jgi:hypothetical protein
MILAINRYRLSGPNFGEERLRVEQVVGWLTYHVVLGQCKVLGVGHYTPPPFQIKRARSPWGGFSRIEGAPLGDGGTLSDAKRATGGNSLVWLTADGTPLINLTTRTEIAD